MSAVQKSKSTDVTHTLPGPYKISSSSDGETISITRSGFKSVSVKASSMKGIKSVLSKFWPTGNERLTPGTEMILLDQFSGNGARLTLGSFVDVAKLVEKLLLPQAASSAVSPSTSEAPVKRGRGRPKKVETAATTPAPTVTTGEVVKKRGRPRKNPEAAEARPAPPVQAASSTSETAEQPKRGRGRPPKQQQPVPTVAAEPAKRGRGRPRKEEQLPTPPSPVSLVTEPTKRRGRPRKAEQVASPAPVAAQPVKRGRGRPPKVEQPVATVATAEPVKRGRGRPPKNAASQLSQSAPPAKQQSAPKGSVSSSLLGSAPSWFGKTFLPQYEAHAKSGASWVLNKVPLKLTMPGSKKVEGVATTPQDVSGWGYEITSQGKHVAWVIVSGPSSLSIVDDGGKTVVPQASMAEVIATLTDKVPAKAA